MIAGLARRLLRPSDPAPTTYFHALDLARGLAACAVLVWHYQHFLALGLARSGTRAAYPFYSILSLLYEQGGAAVQLFWIISGFVFSAVYLASRITTVQFFVNRFGRLYPLHFITLAVVGGLQLLCISAYGHPLIYSTGWPNLGIQMVMASGWTTPVSWSYNGPVWSVSAEILIYALFWIVLPRLFRLGVVGPAAMAAACLALGSLPFLSTVWLCGFYFFVGCTVFAWNQSLHDQPRLLIAIAAAALFASVPVIRFVGQGVGVLLLFTSAVMLLTSMSRWFPQSWARRLGWLGDSTYGIYLWHVPVQLALLLSLRWMGLGREVALARGFFAFYVAAVLVVARLSFTHFERPLRGYIRSRNAASSRSPGR